MALGSLEAEAELQRRSEELEEEQDRKGTAGERDLRRGKERVDRMSERARAAAVKKFYRSGPTKLYARVDQERWYGMSQRERAAAVKSFYSDAEEVFKKKGIRDFVLVVTPLADTTEHLPPLAIGRDGAASPTPLGRSRPTPGI